MPMSGPGIDRHGDVGGAASISGCGRGGTKPVGTARPGSAASVASSAGRAAAGSGLAAIAAAGTAAAAPQQPAPPPPPPAWQQTATGRPAAAGSELAATSTAMAATTAISQQQQPYAQPYGQPNPYAQSYAPQYAASAPSFGTSPLAAFAGLLLVVFGIGVIALGFFALTQGPDIARFIRDNDIKVFGVLISRDTLKSALTPSPGILIFLGALQLIAGAGVMAHKSWGRWLGFLLAVLGLIVSIFAFSIGYAIAGGFTLSVIIGVVFIVGYVLIVLALIGGGAHFRRKTPAR